MPTAEIQGQRQMAPQDEDQYLADTLLGTLRQVMQMQQAQLQMMQQLGQAVEGMTQSKRRVVRDEQGRVVGSEPA